MGCYRKQKMEIDMNKKPMIGAWTLTAPDGRKFVDDTPLHVCRRELEERVPEKIRLERMQEALYGLCQLCEGDIDGDNPLYLAKDTPAEIGPLRLCCFNTIVDAVESAR